MNTAHEIIATLKQALVFHGHVAGEINFNRIKIRQCLPIRIALPVAVKPVKDQGNLLIPKGKAKGPCTHRVFAEVGAVVADHFMRNYVGVLGGQDTEKGRKGSAEPDHEGAVVGRCESPPAGGIHTVKNPCTRRSRFGVQDAVETVHKVFRHKPPARRIGKERAGMETDSAAEIKRIGLPIFRKGPVSGQGGNDVQGAVQFYKAVKQLVGGPHRFKLARKRRIQGGDVAALVVAKNIALIAPHT